MFQPRSDPRAISLSVLFLTARPVCLLSLSTTGWFYFEPRVPSPSLLHLLCSCLCQSLAWPPAEASCPWLTPSQSAEALPHWVMSERCLVVSDSCNPMGCSPLGSSVHGILQARTLEWVVISFSPEIIHYYFYFMYSYKQVTVKCIIPNQWFIIGEITFI